MTKEEVDELVAQLNGKPYQGYPTINPVTGNDISETPLPPDTRRNIYETWHGKDANPAGYDVEAEQRAKKEFQTSLSDAEAGKDLENTKSPTHTRTHSNIFGQYTVPIYKQTRDEWVNQLAQNQSVSPEVSEFLPEEKRKIQIMLDAARLTARNGSK
jgi:plasmid maintenance system killer protein